MRVSASIKICKTRDKNCKVVKRKRTRKDGTKKTVILVINKRNPRFKVCQC